MEVVSQLNWVVENQGDNPEDGNFHQELRGSLENYEILPEFRDITPVIYEDLTGSLKTLIEILARVLSSLPVASPTACPWSSQPSTS